MRKNGIFGTAIALILFFSVGNIWAFWRKKISLKNDTSETFFYAPYYTTAKSARQIAPPQKLHPGESAMVAMPTGKPFCARRILFAPKEEELRPAINMVENQLNNTNSALVGLTHATDISITHSNDIGTFIQPTNAYQIAQERKYLRHVIEQQSPYHEQTAYVQVRDGTLCPEEKAFLEKRSSLTTTALQKYLGTPTLNNPLPRISVCASGGSVRATLAAIGVLQGLSDIGLLPGLTYMTGVSGGTWAIASWLTHNVSIDEHAHHIAASLEKVPSKQKIARDALAETKAIGFTKSLFGHAAGLTDLYGLGIGKIFLKPIDEHFRKITLSSLAKNIHPAMHPFPICTAVTPKQHNPNSYHWIEFSPYEVRFNGNNSCIPTWAFMRRFENGHSVDAMPEPHLGYLMGIWGSAFSVSFADVITKAIPLSQRFLPTNIIEDITTQSWGVNKQFSAKVPNFSYKMSGISETSRPLLEMIDAAHSNNLPVEPLLHPERLQDILIIVNAGIKPKQNLASLYDLRTRLAEQFGSFNLDPDRALAKPLTYWPASGPDAPHIIHVSIHPDADFDASYNPRTAAATSITNFRYSQTEATQLIELMAHTITKRKDKIKKIVQDVVEHKKSDNVAWWDLVASILW